MSSYPPQPFNAIRVPAQYVRPGDVVHLAKGDATVDRVVEVDRPGLDGSGQAVIRQHVKLYDVDGRAFLQQPLDDPVLIQPRDQLPTNDQEATR